MPGRQLPGAAEQAVDHVADRAIAAVHDDEINPVLDSRLRDFAAMAAVSGVLDGQLQTAFKSVRQQVAPRRGGRGCCGVDDQHGAHDAKAYGTRVARLGG